MLQWNKTVKTKIIWFLSLFYLVSFYAEIISWKEFLVENFLKKKVLLKKILLKNCLTHELRTRIRTFFFNNNTRVDGLTKNAIHIIPFLCKWIDKFEMFAGTTPNVCTLRRIKRSSLWCAKTGVFIQQNQSSKCKIEANWFVYTKKVGL